MNSLKKISYEQEVFKVPNNQSLTRTLIEMQKMENQSLKDKDFLLFVNKTFSNIKSLSPLEKCGAVHWWVNENGIYQDDQYDETLISPRIMIYFMIGDCDDFSLLIKTILKVLSVNVRYILLAKEKNDYSHIANVFILSDNKKVYIDATMQTPVYPKQYPFSKVI